LTKAKTHMSFTSRNPYRRNVNTDSLQAHLMGLPVLS
jgi:hypothetical protein